MEMQNIDTQIKELLLTNTSLDFPFVKRTLEGLPKKSEALKKNLQQKLEQHLLGFAEEVSKLQGTDRYQQCCQQAKAYLKNWMTHIEEVPLSQIKKLCKRTNLSFLDIGEDFITPTTLYAYAQKYVKGQDAYLRKLSLCLYTHYKRLRTSDLSLPKANLLAYGPTGVGKTYSVQVLADVLGSEFGVINCNSVVQEGIVGASLTDVFAEIYQRTGQNLAAVEQSVILFDEFDKLFYSGTYNDRIINELLNLIDDNGKATFSTPSLYSSKVSHTISTKKILFLFTGVFDQLNKARINGFVSSETKTGKKESTFYDKATREDFLKVIKKREILGRISDFVALKPMTATILKEILLGDSSPLRSYEHFFELHNTTLKIEEKAIQKLATYAADKQLGVRGLNSLLWEILQQDMQQVQIPTETTESRKLCIDLHYLKNRIKH